MRIGSHLCRSKEGLERRGQSVTTPYWQKAAESPLSIRSMQSSPTGVNAEVPERVRPLGVECARLISRAEAVFASSDGQTSATYHAFKQVAPFSSPWTGS